MTSADTSAGVSAVHAGSQAAGIGIRVAGVSKRFGGVQALRSVDLDIEPGSIHALVGENGAGKSTLGKILSGVLQPDSGHLTLDGAHVTLKSPRQALDVGIATIAQEVSLVPRMSVQDNIFLGAEPQIGGFVQRRELRDRARALIEQSGFDLNPKAVAGDSPLAIQQQVEIVRSLSRRARLVVMDEPTAALNDTETASLHRAIRGLAASGTSVLLVSHFLKEVLALADTITVLRDGQLVRSGPAHAESEDSLIRGMLGRALSTVFSTKTAPPAAAAAVLSARDLVAPGVRGVSLDIAAGEIVGLAGLAGSGRTELAQAIYGSARLRAGTVRVRDHVITHPSPRHSLACGLIMIPESRKDEGLLLGRSISENVSISTLAGLSRHGFVQRRRERVRTSDVLRTLHVPSDRGSAPVGALSGGNQQKVLFARMLMGQPAVIIADEPTRGVDIGAKAAIYELIRSLADRGIGILLISSELEEVIGLSHRVLVLHKGRVSAELHDDAINEESILAAAFDRAPETTKELA